MKAAAAKKKAEEDAAAKAKKIADGECKTPAQKEAAAE
jgi:hypothetical protein